MIKELGPVLTGLMLAGRIGSGIAAELGSMVVTDQINALRALGTDPNSASWRAARAGRLLHGARAHRDCEHGRHPWRMADRRLSTARRVVSAWSSIIEGLHMDDAIMGLVKPFCLVT